MARMSASEQRERGEKYDHLAHWSHKVLTVGGNRSYPEQNLRQSIARARVLERDGSINLPRWQRWLERLGYKGSSVTKMSKMAQQRLLEGRS